VSKTFPSCSLPEMHVVRPELENLDNNPVHRLDCCQSYPLWLFSSSGASGTAANEQRHDLFGPWLPTGRQAILRR
jgi:hypothetical protein